MSGSLGSKKARLSSNFTPTIWEAPKVHLPWGQGWVYTDSQTGPGGVRLSSNFTLTDWAAQNFHPLGGTGFRLMAHVKISRSLSA